MIIAVTNRKLAKYDFLEQIQRVLEKKPDMIILREKDLTEEDYKKLAIEVISLCKKADIPCILHSYWKVAIDLECDKIHLPLPVLLNGIPKQKFHIIGASVHSVEDAILAEKAGATYIIAGHIFATDCKKNIPPRGLQFFRDVCESVSIPVFGIGGMTWEKENAIIQAKGKGICMMSEFMKI